MNIVCELRDMIKLIKAYETTFQTNFGINLNESMVLCCIQESIKLSSDIARQTELSYSHCSKTISSLETKKLVIRIMGKNDKRNMYFSLTDKGKKILQEVNKISFDVNINRNLSPASNISIVKN